MVGTRSGALDDSDGRFNWPEGGPWPALECAYNAWSARRPSAVVGLLCTRRLAAHRRQGKSELRTGATAKREKQSMRLDLYFSCSLQGGRGVPRHCCIDSGLVTKTGRYRRSRLFQLATYSLVPAYDGLEAPTALRGFRVPCRA